MFSAFTPNKTYKLAQAKAAEPAPETTIFTLLIFFLANSNAFNNLPGGDYSVTVVDLDSNTNTDCSTSCIAFIDEVNEFIDEWAIGLTEDF